MNAVKKIVVVLAIILSFVVLVANAVRNREVRRSEKEFIERLSKDGVITDGTVTSVSAYRRYNKGGRGYRVSVYGTINDSNSGLRFESGPQPMLKPVIPFLQPKCTENFNYLKNLEEGSQVKVVYDPNTPSDARVLLPEFETQGNCRLLKYR